ncbi:MAG: zinc-binding alcohol dehydrogenase [Clostridiaceae bacterium]
MKPRRLVAPLKSVIEIEEYDMPVPGPGQVLVESLYTTISPGTELAWLHNMPNTSGRYPYYPGYSGCCRIIGKADDVEGFEAGQAVVCKASHSSHLVIDVNRCIALPENVPQLDASAYRLASIALQGVRKAQIQLGDDVCVVGLGPIGNLAAQFSKVAGAGYVEGIDFVDWRRELALKCGQDAAVASREEAGLKSGYDIVIEATGAPKAVLDAFKLAKRYGKVILLGSTRGNTDDVNFYKDVHVKGLTVIGAHECCRASADNFGYLHTNRNDEETVIKLMAQGRIRTDLLISETDSVENASMVYERLSKKDEKLMLVAFNWK